MDVTCRYISNELRAEKLCYWLDVLICDASRRTLHLSEKKFFCVWNWFFCRICQHLVSLCCACGPNPLVSWNVYFDVPHSGTLPEKTNVFVTSFCC